MVIKNDFVWAGAELQEICGDRPAPSHVTSLLIIPAELMSELATDKFFETDEVGAENVLRSNK